MFENYPEVLTVDDLIEMLRIGKNSAYTFVKKNLKPITDKPIRFLKRDLINYIQVKTAENKC